MKGRLEGISVRSVACVVPRKIFRIAELAPEFPIREIQKIIDNSGIEQVHIADERTTTSDLCERAALKLFRETGISSTEMDGLVFVSQTPDYILPATSHILQSKLGIPGEAFTVDINQGCCGYIYALFIAALLVSSGCCNSVLAMVGDTISKLTGPKDRSVRALMGDCGSATIIEKGDKSISFCFSGDGSRYRSLIVPAGGSRNPYSPESSSPSCGENGNWRSGTDLYMDGLEIMKFALNDVVEFVAATLEEQKIPREKIGLYVFHQANRFIVETLAKLLGLPLGNVPVEVTDVGNTSSASIPLALVRTLGKNRGKDHPRDLTNTMLIGFGVGLSCGTAITDLSETVFLEMEEYP